MDPGVSLQKQNFASTPQKLSKVPGTREEIKKSFTLTIPWNAAKLVKISPGIICTSTPHRSENNGISERAVSRVKEVTSALLLQSGLMQVGGQILWNVTPISKTSQIYFLMGRCRMKDVLGNHFKDLLFHVVYWLSITL